MKLNYTSLQHPVEPVEAPDDGCAAGCDARPVLVLPLHGHLAPAAWAAGAGGAGAADRLRADAGAAPCPGRSRATSPSCASAGCSAATSPPAPATAASTRRSASPARSTPPPTRLGWDAVIAGPGPGILGSATPLRTRRHGGARRRPRSALRSASRRCSRRGSRPPTRGRATAASATTRARCSSCCSRGVEVPVPAGWRIWPARWAARPRRPTRRAAASCRPSAARPRVADLDGYAARACRRGRWAASLEEDRLFFAAPLAAGAALAQTRRQVRAAGLRARGCTGR